MRSALAEATSLVLVPKNSGLAAQSERVMLEYGIECNPRCALRGEDVPNLANQLSRAGKRVLGFTGEDILEDWLAAGYQLDPGLRRGSVAWRDPNALYGKPALCLIGAPGSCIEKTTSPRVGVCARYRHLAARFLASRRTPASPPDLLLMHGTLEVAIAHELADFIIDIVVSGRTIRQAGLEVREVFFTSDLAILESVA